MLARVHQRADWSRFVLGLRAAGVLLIALSLPVTVRAIAAFLLHHDTQRAIHNVEGSAGIIAQVVAERFSLYGFLRWLTGPSMLALYLGLYLLLRVGTQLVRLTPKEAHHG